MGQYYPAGKVGEKLYPEFNRRLLRPELADAKAIARERGLRIDERESLFSPPSVR